MRIETEYPILENGQTILIAYHLYRRCFSIRNANTRKVIGYTDRIVVRNARFIVSQAGRARVLRERKKNVHAYVKGIYEKELQHMSIIGIQAREAYYNPYFNPLFVDRLTNESLYSAKIVVCEEGKVYYRTNGKRASLKEE